MAVTATNNTQEANEGIGQEEERQGKRREVAVSGEKGLTREGNGSNHPDADEFDLLLEEAKKPLPDDILTMEELA